MDAPERIWAWDETNCTDKNPHNKFTTEYIRADLAAPDMAELVEAATAQTAAMTAFWEADEAATYAEEYGCTEDQVWLTDEQIEAMRQAATDLWQSIPALTEATAAALAKIKEPQHG